MYVELHASSAFSFLRSSSLPEDLVKRAAELDYPALALVDRDSLSGAPRFFKAAKKAGIRPLVGAELTLPGGGCLPLLVESRQGYRNLCRLITLMKEGVPKGTGALSPELLPGRVDGLIAFPGIETLGRHLTRIVWPGCFRGFGARNVAVDVQRQRWRSQEVANQVLLDLADSLGLPAVATNGVRHARGRGGRSWTCSPVFERNEH